MSEHIPTSPEHKGENVEAHRERSEHHRSPAEQAEHEPKGAEKNIEQLRQTLAEEAKPATSEQADLAQAEVHAAETATSLSRDVKQQSLRRVLKHVRSHLSWPQRSLSRLIHQPIIDGLSEIGAKSVARPSGILGGGIMAFAGSLVFLYYAKHVGFTYNYLLFALFFVGGFAIGVVFELLIWVLLRARRS